MGSARTDQNFTSVNEHAMLDGVVYLFSFEPKKASDTVIGPLILFYYFFCGERVPWYSGYNFFLEGKRKRVIINSMKRNLLKRLS